MKKVLCLILLAVACSKKEAAPPAVTSRPAPPAPPPVVRHEGKPSYDEAVIAFRSSPGFHFEIAIGSDKASGDLLRPRIGQELMRFKSGGDEWIAARHAGGVAWYRNGKREKNESAFADRVYQWIVMFNDPEKTPPQNSGDHIEFKNLNTNENVSVWIAPGNHLTKLHTTGTGTAFPAVSLEITHDGESAAIQEPKS